MSLKISCCPVLDGFHCCCCKCSLKSATLTVSWIEVVASTIQFALSLMCVVEFESTVYQCWLTKRRLTWFIKSHQFWADSVDFYIPLVSQAAILYICCLLLLYGAHNKKPVYMIPYLMICHLGIWLLVLLTAVSGFSELLIELSTGLIIIMGGSILVVIAWYLWLVKYSYYRKLVEELRQSKAQKHGCPESPVIEEDGITHALCSHTCKI